MKDSCDSCEKWFHYDQLCSGLINVDIPTLRNANIYYLCNRCEASGGEKKTKQTSRANIEILQEIQEMRDEITKMQHMMDGLFNQVSKSMMKTSNENDEREENKRMKNMQKV